MEDNNYYRRHYPWLFASSSNLIEVTVSLSIRFTMELHGIFHATNDNDTRLYLT